MVRLALAFAALACLWAPAAAQPGQKQQAWTVDHGKAECSLGRFVGPDARTLFAIRVTPGMQGGAIWLVNLPDGRRRKPSRIVFRPGDVGLKGALQERKVAGGVAHTVTIAPEEMTLLQSAKNITVRSGNDEMATFALPGLAKGLDALRECERSTLAAWGIDPEDHFALRAPPRGERELFNYVTHQDYPNGAAARGESGDVVMRIDVAADGKLSSCAVLESSGFRELDERSCDVLRKRAKFVPAVSADGRAVAGSLVSKMSWRVYNH